MANFGNHPIGIASSRERGNSQNFGHFMVGESDLESLHLSTVEMELSSVHKLKNLKFLNYQTATCDEMGGITNYEESATDNDFDFKSVLRGLGCPPNAQQPGVY